MAPSEIKHTPGPWVVSANSAAMTEVRAGNQMSGRVVATAFCRSSAKSREGNLAQIRINEANARLIAAAPEMKEALEGFVASLTRNGKSRYGELSVSHSDLTGLVQKARAALAKACIKELSS